MPQFSTHESVSLEKYVDLKGKLADTDSSEIADLYEVERCAEWIRQNDFKKVCLQFPDYLLPDSSDIALKLQNILGQTVYILGDTAYESCCIDYVAAAHINADAIIHFGPTCFSRTSGTLPYLNIYEKHPINLKDLESSFKERFGNADDEAVALILDDEYIHCFENTCKIFKDLEGLKINKIGDDIEDLDDKTVIFIGSNQRKLLNFCLSFKFKSLYYFDPSKPSPDIAPYELDGKVLKRRYFLMEKIKDANTIGIVIGTLAIKDYLKVIERIKNLIQFRGKKYYLISVGKPTVAKLANLGEIDVYVMISCSMNEVYDSRDFYKPIVTPYDVEMALNPEAVELQFSYNYNRYLNTLDDVSKLKKSDNETDISLLTGKLRSVGAEGPLNETIEENLEIAIKTEGTLAVSSHFGAGYLSERTWKGVEQKLGETEVKLAEEGRKGIAQGYQNENS